MYFCTASFNISSNSVFSLNSIINYVKIFRSILTSFSRVYVFLNRIEFFIRWILLACLLCFLSVHTPNSWSRCTRKHNIFWKLFATCFLCNACVGFSAFASASAFASRVWNRLKTWKDHRTKWYRHNTNHCICMKFHHLCQCLIFGW